MIRCTAETRINKMPKDFITCTKKKGSKVVTKKLKGGKYIKICYDKDGNSYSGEVEKKKSTSDIIEEAKKVSKDLKDLKETVR